MEKQSDWAPAVAALGEDKVLLGRLDGTFGVYELATGKPVVAAPVAKASKKTAAPDTKPVLTRIEPRGVQSGATTRLKVTGKNLAGLKSALFSQAWLKATIVSVNPEGTVGELDVVTESTVPRSQVDLALATPTGETARLKVNVDYLPQVVGGSEIASADLKLPVNVWGTLRQTGQVDTWKFAARKGETVVFDLAAKRLESKAGSPRLEIVNGKGKLLATNNGLDSGSDPFIAFQAPEDGEYKVLVREITLSGSDDHVYRLTAGVLPYVTGWWPLSAAPNTAATVHLVGHNLKTTEEPIQIPAEGEAVLPLDTDHYRSRVSMKVAVNLLPQATEVEPNDEPGQAQTLTLPASVNGRLYTAASVKVDADLFRFEAAQGQLVVLETRAGMMGSPADTKLEVLDAKGEVVPMMRMQATKDSWITLRSEDANDPAIRLGHFAEMDLKDYMFFNGEVLKIYRQARGPGADMVYFSNGGKRRAYFNTSPAGHGLDDACYTVEPRALDKVITPNGLPVFTLNYANDDDGFRELGRDSRLVFTVPAAGAYFVRVSDTRGWSGERQAYQLILRAPAPDFTPQLRMPAQLSIPTGSGAQFAVTVDRVDDFEGAVRVVVSDVPQGFYVSSPLVIEAGHLDVAGSIYALPGTVAGASDFSKMRVTATALVEGKEVTKPVAGFAKVTVAAPLKRSVFMEPDVAGKPAGDGKSAPAKPYEITLTPGSQVPAWLRMDRRGDDALVGLDVEGLPHGVIVDNIGLNGVQIRAGENEREIFLSCAPWVAEQDRLCHVVVGSARNDAVKADGAQTGFPVLLKIRKTAKAVAGP
ncbi:MAG: PPC domain-containing protein, partial [Verrucomicrobium sp.]